MSVFAVSDLHLPGGNVINKSMDMFGPRWHEHVSRIEKGWRSVVGDGDTVVVGGDISWAMTLDDARDDLLFLDSLPGKKIIFEGNHDYWWPTNAKLLKFFAENGITTVKLLRGTSYERDGIVICGTRGWFAEDSADMRTHAGDVVEHEKLVRREAGRLRTSIDAGLALTGGDPAPLRAFLHFPAAFGRETCEPILDVLRETRVPRVYFGHIHGFYDYARTFEAHSVSHCAMAADYLGFVPRLVR